MSKHHPSYPPFQLQALDLIPLLQVPEALSQPATVAQDAME